MSIRYAILGLLSCNELTGYDFKGIFERTINFFWTANLSQVYRELSKLEKEGYICHRVEPQEGKPDKKLYKATEEGRKAFEKWISKFPDKIRQPTRDELALRMFFSSKIPKDELLFQLKKIKREMEQLLAVYKKIEESIDSNMELSHEDKTMKKVSLYIGIYSAEGKVSWADKFISELEPLQ